MSVTAVEQAEDLDVVQLVADLRSGCESASCALYEAFGARVYDYLSRMLRNRDDAADATQDTFLLATQRIDQLRDPERLRGWLFTIARFEGLRYARHRANRSEASIDVVGDLADNRHVTPTEALEYDEVRSVVLDVLRALPERDRTVLLLTYDYGLAGSDLGRVLGVSPNHAAVIAMRARTRAQRAVRSLALTQVRPRCPGISAIMDRHRRFDVAAERAIHRHAQRCGRCQADRARPILRDGRFVGGEDVDQGSLAS